MSKMRRCNWVGCYQRIPYDQRYCDIHQVAHMKQREHMLKEIDDNLKGTMREAHLKRQAQAKYDEEVRDTDATSFYHSRRWVRLSKYVKVKQGYTSEVSGQLLNDNDCQVDHIIKRSLLPEQQWYDTDNLWLLSRHEHSIKTAIETKMLRDNKANVLLHLDKKWWKKVINEKINDSDKG